MLLTEGRTQRERFVWLAPIGSSSGRPERVRWGYGFFFSKSV